MRLGQVEVDAFAESCFDQSTNCSAIQQCYDCFRSTTRSRRIPQWQRASVQCRASLLYDRCCLPWNIWLLFAFANIGKFEGGSKTHLEHMENHWKICQYASGERSPAYQDQLVFYRWTQPNFVVAKIKTNKSVCSAWWHGSGVNRCNSHSVLARKRCQSLKEFLRERF